MKRLQHTGIMLLITALAACCFSSCKKDKDSTPVNTLQTLISQDTSLTIFAAVLKRTQLSTFTTGPGPFTIFAPTNTAYAKQFGIRSASDVDTMNLATLTVQTSWLIAPGSFTSDVLVGLNVPITTQISAGTIYASSYSNTTYFNGNPTKTRDILASNGVLHTLDYYLYPAPGTTSVTLGVYSGFKLWLQAITKSKLTLTTSINRSTTTLLSPTDVAMKAAGYDSTAIANATTTAMANLVKYHTIGTRYFLYALSNTTYKTDLGSSLTFNVTGTPTITGKNNSVHITARDLTSTNGVIHAIDGVLTP